jgi:hypothetical protein
VEADQSFTVGVEIDSCGDQIPDQATFQIINPSPFITIQEPLSQNVGPLTYANSQRFLTFHMQALPNAPSGVYNFNTKLVYGNSTYNVYAEQDGNFSVTVNTQPPQLTVSGIKTDPDQVTSDTNVILTVNIENQGDGNAKDVVVKLDGLNFQGTQESYLGEIYPNEELPARFVLRSGLPGMNNFTVDVYYTTNGQNQILQFPYGIEVFNFSTMDFWYWVIIIGIIVISIFAFVYLRRKNKARKENEED